MIDRLNSISKGRLALILNSNKFYGRNIKEILNNQEAFNGLNYINEDQLIFLLDSEKFSSYGIMEILSDQAAVNRLNSTTNKDRLIPILNASLAAMRSQEY
ncbi:MAG: hypothetical protein PG981_000338 [Wolbachia endosymbiont of Ctenocephalides orientis wCori]|nr:MAG: hypothetical protein PG981_000338 [Wolbachia endosymbiont of Ctenocephalides orientis wCori]